jgi:hypothetical protein
MHAHIYQYGFMYTMHACTHVRMHATIQALA